MPGSRSIDWSAHLAPSATLACEFSGRHPAITHTHFGTLKLKDGIVDALRAAHRRPARRRARAPGRARARARSRHAGHGLDRPCRGKPAPPRLSGRSRRGAAQGERGCGRADALAVAGAGRARRGIPRSAVRLGYLLYRSGADGRRPRSGPDARSISDSSAGGATTRRLWDALRAAGRGGRCARGSTARGSRARAGPQRRRHPQRARKRGTRRRR